MSDVTDNKPFGLGLTAIDEVIKCIDYTFCFNSKCSLLKLLCTLARLCKGTLLQPLRLDFFGIDFPSHPQSQLPFIFSLLAGSTTREKARRAHERAPTLNLTTPATIAPPRPPPHNHPHIPLPLNWLWHPPPLYLPLIPRQGNLHTSPFRVAVLRWRNVSPAFLEMHSPCSSFDMIRMR